MLDKKVLYHQQRPTLSFNSTHEIYNVFFKYASLPNLYFLSLQCSKNGAERTFVLATGKGALHSIFARNAPHTACVRQTEELEKRIWDRWQASWNRK